MPEHNFQGISSRLAVGKIYTIEELLEAMIVDSDNVATILLEKQLELDKTKQVFSDFAVALPSNLQTSENFITAAEYASFLRVLYNSTYLNKESSEYALRLLAKTKFTDGIAAGIPTGIPISHKFGASEQSDGTKQLHDCGIIYDPETKDYIVCIMTSGNDYQTMATAIGEVTAKVHTTMRRNTRK